MKGLTKVCVDLKIVSCVSGTVGYKKFGLVKCWYKKCYKRCFDNGAAPGLSTEKI